MPELEGSPDIWRAMGHPIRRRIRVHLDEHGPATATTLAQALGLNTGSTSYHLRVLAEAGMVEEVPRLRHGKERWWQVLPVDLREPTVDRGAGTDAGLRAAADARRSEQVTADLALLRELHDRGRELQPWAGICRGTVWLTADELRDFVSDHQALVARHSRTSEERPPEARRMAVRMFLLPDAGQLGSPHA